MITLIFNADDFGYSRGTNYGILETFKKGIVTSATMMMNMEGTEHAVEIAKQHKELGVGIHLVLTCGKPLSEVHEVNTLVDEKGRFYKNPKVLFEAEIDIRQVEKEWRKQIESFFAYGLTPTHLDSHHHVHFYEKLRLVIQKLAKEFSLPVRIFPNMGSIRPFSDVFVGDFFGKGISHELLYGIVEKAKDGQVIEVMTHPAYVDADLLAGSSYNLDRIKETELLMTWDIPKNVRIYRKRK